MRIIKGFTLAVTILLALGAIGFAFVVAMVYGPTGGWQAFMACASMLVSFGALFSAANKLELIAAGLI